MPPSLHHPHPCGSTGAQPCPLQEPGWDGRQWILDCCPFSLVPSCFISGFVLAWRLPDSSPGIHQLFSLLHVFASLCPLSLPVASGQNLGAVARTGAGGDGPPVEELLAIPSPSPDCPSRRRDISSQCVPQHVLGFVGSAGDTEGQEEKSNQERGKHNLTVTHKRDHHHHKKGNFVEHGTFILWNSTRGWDRVGGGTRASSSRVFLEDSGPLESVSKLNQRLWPHALLFNNGF